MSNLVLETIEESCAFGEDKVLLERGLVGCRFLGRVLISDVTSTKIDTDD